GGACTVTSRSRIANGDRLWDRGTHRERTAGGLAAVAACFPAAPAADRRAGGRGGRLVCDLRSARTTTVVPQLCRPAQIARRAALLERCFQRPVPGRRRVGPLVRASAHGGAAWRPIPDDGGALALRRVLPRRRADGVPLFV